MNFGSPDLLFLLGTILVMYFLFFLPQRRKQQALTKMIAALKRGDRVVTTAGMHGEITAVGEKTVTLKFHGDTRVDFDKTAVAHIVDGTAA
ncbi:MAG TPA: preprotein translocase subunit YajC [Fibrobacteria bacterium]|nr:preprotein translocase subunit YajC [Fibrobacteria bacterium]